MSIMGVGSEVNMAVSTVNYNLSQVCTVRGCTVWSQNIEKYIIYNAKHVLEATHDHSVK